MAQISLRAVEPKDIDFLYRIENLPQVWSVSWGDAPVSREILWQYICNYTADIYADRQLRLIIESEGTAVGTLDITDYDPRNSRAMLGIAVDTPYQHRGIATASIMEAISMCRDRYAMHQLAVMVPKDNEASLRLFEKAGFKTSGCLRSWLRRGQRYTDVIVMQLLLP